MQKTTWFWGFAVAIPLLALLPFSLARESQGTSTKDDSSTKRIVPVVALKPGESTKLLLSTHCTVGATRGLGFVLSEMFEGKSNMGPTSGNQGATYLRDGIEIAIPGWEAAEKFASSPTYRALREQGIQVFEVTVSASTDAKPGLVNMHVGDSTCNGACYTDFRVLVVSP